MDGQISFFPGYNIARCGHCVCYSCLFKWSGRCPHGGCYDDKRAIENPYDKAHPNKPPRTWWSNWKTEQAYWCRGGTLYPVYHCDQYERYKGCVVQECLEANVAVYQDGHIRCSLVDASGCEECYRRFEERMEEIE